MSAPDSTTAAGVGPRRERVRTAWLTAAVAGLFVTLVGVRMVVGHVRGRPEDPREAPQLAAARERLKAKPTDETLKAEIRQLDVRLRRAYWRHLETNGMGAWLLVGGLLLGVVAGRLAWEAQSQAPRPQPVPPGSRDPARDARRARWAVGGMGLVVALGLWVASSLSRPPLPGSVAALEKLLAGGGAGAAVETGPSREEMAENWPRFRGPNGDGVASGTNAPTVWDGATGEGVLWKSAVPVPGFSSPIVWGDRLFLTGGTEEAREVLCYHAGTGELLWRKTVPTPAAGFGREFEVPEHTGYAASTAATDGRHVFAIFLTGELAAFDFGGRLVWSKFLGVPENPYGHATSLLTWRNRLIVQFDQGEAKAGKSRLYAFDAGTGQVRWEQRRAAPSSWTTPVIVEAAGREQLITLAEPWIISYDPAEGAELWRASGLGADLAPSPILAGDLLVVVSPGREMSAWRLDGQGDVTATHRVWKFEEALPDITSPVSHGGLLFVVTTFGQLVCLESATGARVWEKDLEQEFNASPVRAGDRLYLTTTKGLTILVAAAREFRELGRNELGEGVHASLALAGGRIYVRGRTNLYGLGRATPKP